MTTKQAFVSEAFHPEDSIRQVWDDLMLRAGAKARGMGGVFAEAGSWSVSPPLDDDDFCFHVRLMFSVSVRDLHDLDDVMKELGIERNGAND